MVNVNQENMLDRKHSGMVQQTKDTVTMTKFKNNRKDSWLDPLQ